MLHRARLFATLLAGIFLLPALATAGWWTIQDRPSSWRAADWSSSGLLPLAGSDTQAAIYVLAARTGGLKGALSVHSWIVVKRAGSSAYERYDKVGWGNPIRRDGYPADGNWYSNAPDIVHAVHGELAEKLIPEFDAAIASYPYARPGGYRLWPGPNSNTFVAHVLHAVPGFGGRLPPNAVGRDFARGPGLATFSFREPGFRATLGGLAGFSITPAGGVEIHLGGLVAGIDLGRPGLLIPGWGRFGW